MSSRAELLQDVANMMAAGIAETEQFSGLIYLSEQRPDGNFDIGFKDLGNHHPLAGLMGLEAPRDWWAIGAVATAWMADYSGEAGFHDNVTRKRPSEMSNRQRVATAALVARDGTIASCVRHEDGSVFTEAPSAGLVCDALHRCLGLPTPPPSAPPADFFVILWLRFVEVGAQAARANLDKMTWVRAARCFPSLGQVRARDIADVDAFADLVMHHVGNLGWPALRRWGTHGSLRGIITADLARWMDDGMFSRHVMGELPLLATQLEKTCFRLNPAVGEKVRAAADALLLRGTAAAA